jgi:hypothetical protein
MNLAIFTKWIRNLILAYHCILSLNTLLKLYQAWDMIFSRCLFQENNANDIFDDRVHVANRTTSRKEKGNPCPGRAADRSCHLSSTQNSVTDAGRCAIPTLDRLGKDKRSDQNELRLKKGPTAAGSPAIASPISAVFRFAFLRDSLPTRSDGHFLLRQLRCLSEGPS